MTLSIIIVTYNSSDLIVKCLQSVSNSLNNIGYEIVVIDNASTNDSVDYVKVNFPQVKIIQNDKNLGFAKAVNQGLNEASGEFILLLNPDVFISEGFIERMLNRIKQSPDIGSVAGKLYFAKQDSSKTKTIYSTGHIFFKTCHSINRGYGEEDAGQYDGLKEIFGVNGAAALYRRKMLEDVKINEEYYDENFFLYREDEDMDWRARLRGWQSKFEPKAIAYHVSAEMRDKKTKLAKQNKILNRYLLLKKNVSLANYLILLPHLFFYEVLLFLVGPVVYIKANLKRIVSWQATAQTRAKRTIILQNKKVSDGEIRGQLKPLSFPEMKRFFSRQKIKRIRNIS